MKIPKRPTDRQDFILPFHKEDGVPIEGAPVFKLKPLSISVFDDVQDMQFSGEQISGAENITIGMRRSKAFRLAAKHGVVGWENIEDESGNSIDYKNFHDLDQLPDAWVHELGAQCYLISMLTETEKNS